MCKATYRLRTAPIDFKVIRLIFPLSRKELKIWAQEWKVWSRLNLRLPYLSNIRTQTQRDDSLRQQLPEFMTSTITDLVIIN